MIGMTAALATRPTLGLSVQRDRAPLFVPLADGSLRNGYTVKIANKTQSNAAFDLSVGGLPGATLVIAEGDPKPSRRCCACWRRPMKWRRSACWSPLGRPALTDGSQPIDFMLRDTTTGKQTVYHSTFMGPPGYAGG